MTSPAKSRAAPVPSRKPQLVVPAYFHPAVRPRQWQWLAEHAALIRLVILNVASGPGTKPQDEFRSAVDLLHEAGVSVVGYVDTGYGGRDAQQVLAETGRYQDWYGVQGVCLDQVATSAENLGHYAAIADRLRAMGAQVVFFNHGAHPDPGYVNHADLIGTFEGTWQAYQRLRVPGWTRRWPSSKWHHVVHSVPAELIPDAWRLAARRKAGAIYITERSGPNPYDGLPTLSRNDPGVEVR
jgi:hypothetical protein